MIRRIADCALLAGALLTAHRAACADPESPATSPAPTAQNAGDGFAAGYPRQRLNLLTKASDLIETEVWDRAGHKLGKIEDFVVDWNSGRVYCALVWPEHLYGASNYFVAIPAKCFISADENEAIINTNLASLIGSPRFLRSGWDTTAVANSLSNAYRRFDQPLTWDAKSGPGVAGKYVSLLGTEVNNRANVNIGNLADLVIDLPAQKIMFAVISFYGTDQNLHAVPFPAVTVASNKQNLVLDVDDSKIGTLVSRDEFMEVEVADPFWVTGAFSEYGKQPDFDTTSQVRLNAVRPEALANVENPPLVASQPALAADDSALARKVMTTFIQTDMANATVASGVKISASHGNVTLAGHIGSEAKKMELQKTAESVAGFGNVTDELEVR